METATICDLIRQWAGVKPDAPALISDSAAPLTYARLAQVMDATRDSLNRSGFGRGDRIGILHSGGADMMSVILGVMSGATAVPLNPKFSESELAFHIRNSGVKALLAETRLGTPAAAVADSLGIPILEIRRGDPAITGDIAVEARAVTRPVTGGSALFEDVALVMATSGSTSIGKVVPLRWRQCMTRRHRNMVRFKRGPDDCCYIFKPFYYHSAVGNCMDGLYCGARTLISPHLDTDRFLPNLISHQVTWMSCGPAFLRALRDSMDGRDKTLDGHRLRYICCGTSRLDPAFADELESLLGVPVLESYATTETGRLAYNPLPPDRRKHGTVGVTCPEEVAIMAPDGTLLGPGERGEIVGRGDQVFEGYENDAAANGAGFVDGWFRTGDEGFLDEEGYLTLTGRIKEMINRGGDKVSPAEVDAVLISHPDVCEAASFPIPHETLGEEVAAAVVLAPGAEVDAQALKRYLLGTLLHFKVPRRFVFVDEIPKDASGKVRRHELAKALDADTLPAPSGGDEAGRVPSPLEARLQTLWAKALKLDHVGLDEDFFLLGGDSLKAVDLFLTIERDLQRRLPVGALFEAATVAEMAGLVEKEKPPGCLVPIRTTGDRPPFFCVHGNGGEVIGFYPLSKHLGSGQPFYGLQSVGWDGKVVPFTSSEDMVAHYLAEIRKVQPRGPYYLGGYSFGGRIAVYMARQLRAEGEDIALLAILDSSSYLGRHYVTLQGWLERRGDPQGRRRPGAVLGYLWFRTRKAYDCLYERLRRAVLFRIWERYRRTGRPLPHSLRRPSSANKLIRIAQRKMPAYDGDAVYFRARPSEPSNTHQDTRDTWDRLITGRLDVIAVPGTHDQIIREPFVRTLAEALGRALEQARAGQDPEARAAGRTAASGW
jgi:acyl-CoA synthetase (AMP-forming)/AMP-acid ligase II/thioesterase domain-containing protein/acyl carrier protein